MEPAVSTNVSSNLQRCHAGRFVTPIPPLRWLLSCLSVSGPLSCSSLHSVTPPPHTHPLHSAAQGLSLSLHRRLKSSSRTQNVATLPITIIKPGSHLLFPVTDDFYLLRTSGASQMRQTADTEAAKHSMRDESIPFWPPECHR